MSANTAQPQTLPAAVPEKAAEGHPPTYAAPQAAPQAALLATEPAAAVAMTEKAQPQAVLPPQQAPYVVAAPIAAAADNAISADAIRMTFLQYVTIRDIKEVDSKQVPPELASRGLTQKDFYEVVEEVRIIKKSSDNNKIMLWTGCIFFCGIIGWLLVSQRALGNRHLHKQLETPLEDINRKLMNRGISVRWTWTEGTLRGYYK